MSTSQTVNLELEYMNDYEFFNKNYSLEVLEKLYHEQKLAERLFADINTEPRGMFCWFEHGRNGEGKVPFAAARLGQQCGIYKRKEKYIYYRIKGSVSNEEEIQESDAEKYAQKIYSILYYIVGEVKNSKKDTIEDYKLLYRKIEEYLKDNIEENNSRWYWNKKGEPSAFILKYLFLTFPYIFVCIYNSDDMINILRHMNVEPIKGKKAFLLNVQIAMTAKDFQGSNAKYSYWLYDQNYHIADEQKDDKKKNALDVDHSIWKGDDESQNGKSGVVGTNGYGENVIYYGAPGCGKSYYVDKTVLNDQDYPKTKGRKESVFRTTFYADYTNTDFVGQILPHVTKNSVTYKFVPGPFTLALAYAKQHPDVKVALVIEELNRGNAPSIFGDIFQLLDRDEKGVSRYPITNLNIQSYTGISEVVIPGNLYIYATMNTSDQNVFTLDTAFKRRWKFKKISNKFENDQIGKKIVPGIGCIWKDFVETINKHIIDNQVSLSDEDKQLGKYFVSEDMLLKQGENDTQEKKKEEFAYKVFEYLWHDVAKFNRDKWFDSSIRSLDELIEKFMDDNNVFASGITFTPKTQSSPVAQPQNSNTGTESDESDSMSNNEDK